MVWFFAALWVGVSLFDVWLTRRRALKFGGIRAIELSRLICWTCERMGLAQGLFLVNLWNIVTPLALAALGFTTLLTFLAGLKFGWFIVQVLSLRMEAEMDTLRKLKP